MILDERYHTHAVFFSPTHALSFVREYTRRTMRPFRIMYVHDKWTSLLRQLS